MNKEFNYSSDDYQKLEEFLLRAESISFGSPDQYQFHQNELSKCLAYFLLKPYKTSKNIDS